MSTVGQTAASVPRPPAWCCPWVVGSSPGIRLGVGGVKVIETIIGIIAGLVITIIISRYYYRLGARRRLSVYVLRSFQAMSDLDPDIKKDFSVEFNGAPVRSLTVLDLLIANEGTHPVRDYVEPLSIQMPDGVNLLNVMIPYVYPEGRHADVIVKSGHSFEYQFSILNPREYFLTKIVADGYIDADELLITITADNLPPRIKPEAGDHIEAGKRSPIGSLAGLAAAAIYAFSGLCLVSMLSLLWHVNRNLLPAWLHLPMPYPASMVAVMTIIYILLDAMLILAAIFAALSGHVFLSNRRFPLPEAVAGKDRPLRVGAGVEIWRENNNWSSEMKK